MHNYHLSPMSNNAKTGPIAVSTTSSDSCPNSCELKANGCYAKSGPLALHWRKVDSGERGISLDRFCHSLMALEAGRMFRHNQGGDLPGDGELIDHSALSQIIKASKHLKAFTYTHYRPENEHNAALIYSANKAGFVVNLSAKSINDADYLASLAIAPIVCLVPENQQESMQTPEGRNIVICPATYKADVNCMTCQLCANNSPTRPIIGFPAHGAGKKKAQQASGFSVITMHKKGQ